MLEVLEKKIANYFKRKYSIFLGSGTTSLYVIYKVLGLNKDDLVLYPNITCETALNSSIYAGLKPIFSDIELKNYNFDINNVFSLTNNNKIKVIVATHIFGNNLNIPELRKRIDKDIFILEDAAQTFGSKACDSITGKMGDASIISFGKGKIIDCGGGGAILTDNEDFYNKCCVIRESLNENPIEREELRKVFMKEIFELNKVYNDKNDFIEKRDLLKIKFKNIYLFKAEKKIIEKALNLFENIDEIIIKRKKLCDELYNFIEENIKYVDLPIIEGDKLFWRLTFLVKNDRDKIYNELVKNDIKVTRFFKPLHMEYDLNDQIYPKSQEFYNKVINLRLDIEDNDIEKLFKALTNIKSLV